ncbi:hypothetical protein FE784_15970 [Paenibacillus hemerocallicola]|uniref:Uncharacterized protein n=1 Tax=Paenibacillus hemerocallicola TaxID=1172614 RepID=A0A5C4T8G2_9BACL|nr:hypothetical protein [Paenibacillus hemerocallicola]TNJ65311.1 hypothetical protein FE784_15970 [Paenibacillus hemerocallicola]
MEFPPWFRQVIQQRVDKAAAQAEHHSDLKQIKMEEERAFRTLFAGIDTERMAEFSEWEDRHGLKQALINEKIYLSGMQEGIQLAVALLYPSLWRDGKEPPGV